MMTVAEVHGHVASGFEPVRLAFAERLGELGQGGAAFAAVLKGQPIVDIWAGRAGLNEWRSETRVVWHAATNGFVAIVVAGLVDKGLIDVQAPVAKYWPEFAANGKADVTVAQILSHRSGVVTIPDYADFMKASGEGWGNTQEIVRRLASASPTWPPGTAHGYHGLTFFWLVGEVVRRVTGKSLGTLLRQEISSPLALELDLGTPMERQRALASPTVADEPLPPNVQKQLQDSTSLVSQTLLGVSVKDYYTNSIALDTNPVLLSLELGYNVTATARAAATLYGALAYGGRLSDRQIIATETIESFTREASSGIDRVVGSDSRFGLGFMLAMPPDGRHPWGPHSESFGHTGLGVQFSLADPVSHLGVGFARSHYSWKSRLGTELLDILYDCVAMQ